MNKLNPIGIIGDAGAGKDTVADIITGILDYRKTSFASKIYEFAAGLTGLTIQQLQDRNTKEVVRPFELQYTKTEYVVTSFVNSLLLAYIQTTGVDVHRTDLTPFEFFCKVFKAYITIADKDTDTFSMTLSPRIILQLIGTELMRQTYADDIWIKLTNLDGAVVPDVRFVNEAHEILKNNGVLVVVKRNIQSIAESSHSSEVGKQEILSNCPYFVIDNNADLANLEKAVHNFINHYMSNLVTYVI
jgi:hypothetical protein